MLLKKFIGVDLKEKISKITGIEELVLSNYKDSIRRISIAQRMSWASERSTTRIGDEAYSLLGIFEVNMPLIYGEEKRALFRLQEEIMKRSTESRATNRPNFGITLCQDDKISRRRCLDRNVYRL